MSIHILSSDSIDFPSPNQALEEPNGLLAMGGDLSLERIIAGYRQGIFAWFNLGDPILWWSPNPRAILKPEQLYINRSLQRVLNKRPFRLSVNERFEAVIDGCAAPRKDTNETWITPEMREAYLGLHEAGYAYSYECWQGPQLVGGLYGVRLGGVFFAESMFHTADNASKVAICFLCQHMQETQGALIDIQIISPHLAQMGACEIDRERYLNLLKKHL